MLYWKLRDLIDYAISASRDADFLEKIILTTPSTCREISWPCTQSTRPRSTQPGRKACELKITCRFSIFAIYFRSAAIIL